MDAGDLGQWGIAGLLFVMWWLERRDRLAANGKAAALKMVLEQSNKTNGELVTVVKEITTALGELRVQLARQFARPDRSD